MKKKLLILLLLFLISDSCFGENNKIYKVVKCDENNNVCIVRDKKLNYGLADKNQNIVLPMEYTRIKRMSANDSNYLLELKTQNGNYLNGIANSKGVIIIKPQYYKIENYKIEGKYRIQPNNDFMFGLIDRKTGHVDIPPIYTHFYKMPNGDINIEKDNTKTGIMNNTYKVTIPPEYDLIVIMNGDKYYRLYKEVTFTNSLGIQERTDKYGIADRNGKIIVPVECEWIQKENTTFDYEVIKNGKKYIFNSKNGSLKQI